MIFGNASSAYADAPLQLAADTTRVTTVAAPGGELRAAKLSVLLDGLGSGSGEQTLRGVIYDQTSGALLGTSEPVVVLDGQAKGWVDFSFARPLRLAYDPANLRVGVQGSEATGTVRLYSYAGTTTGRLATDSYLDGPADPFPASSAAAGLAIFVTASTPLVLPEAPDDYYVDLPEDLAQQVFGSTAVDPGIDAMSVTCGWHWTRVDPARGFYALAHPSSPLADYVGERIKITTRRRRSVYVYVKDENGELLDDLSIPRGAFARLAFLGDEAVPVRVEVLT